MHKPKSLLIALCFTSVTWIAQPAFGIGQCENVGSTTELAAVSKAGDALIFVVDEGWCDEESGEEGTLRLALVTDLDQSVVHTFTLEKDSAETRAALDMLGADLEEVRFADAYDAFREKTEFVDLDKLASASCEVVVETTASDETYNEFPSGASKLEVKVGAETIKTLTFEDVAVDEGGASAQVAFVPGDSSLIIWSSVPRCEGGPPPGYFGEDDPGECYIEAETTLTRLSLADHPRLAACFSESTEGDSRASRGVSGEPKLAPTPNHGGCASCSQTAQSGTLPHWGAALLFAAGALLVTRKR